MTTFKPLTWLLLAAMLAGSFDFRCSSGDTSDHRPPPPLPTGSR